MKVSLSPIHDHDLIQLYKRVGRRNFTHIVYLCVKGLKEPILIEEAKLLIANTQLNVDVPDKIICSFSFLSKEYKDFHHILSKLPKRTKGAFIKQYIRFSLGTEIIFACYFKDAYNIEINSVTTLQIKSGENIISKTNKINEKNIKNTIPKKKTGETPPTKTVKEVKETKETEEDIFTEESFTVDDESLNLLNALINS